MMVFFLPTASVGYGGADSLDPVGCFFLFGSSLAAFAAFFLSGDFFSGLSCPCFSKPSAFAIVIPMSAGDSTTKRGAQ